MKRNVLIFLYRFPLIGVMTLRRLVGKYICLTQPLRFDDQGFASNNTGLSGTVGNRDQFNYGVNLSHQHQGNETTAGANLTWNAPVATVNGSYSQSSTYRQAGASVSGGIVAWSGGVNLANRLSETFAVMNAPGIKDAYVNGQKYRTTNRNGVVVYDGMTPMGKSPDAGCVAKR